MYAMFSICTGGGVLGYNPPTLPEDHTAPLSIVPLGQEDGMTV